MDAISRRQLMQYGAAAAGGGLLAAAGSAPAVAGAQPLASGLPVPAAWRAVPFGLDQVTLATSVFTEKRDRILAYARAYPADRILSNFRAAAGLDTLGAQPPGGWDDATGLLRGHYSGHFMSMLAQAYASTGEAAFKDKLDTIVAGLKLCQDAWAGKASHAGFLAAYPETQFIQLEQYATYPTIWAPYYTCHKIMRGLLDSYTLTGNATALTVVKGMGDWVYSRLGGLPRTQLDRMWSIYIAGEYGGMNEVMADLYSLTGTANYLTAARCFDNTTLLNACVAGTDTLDGKHANQHIPQFLGYLRVFEQGGAATYHTAAVNFFDMVVPHRTYSHGGTGQGEFFRKRDAIAGSIDTTTNAESCAAYNMLKVARNLFLHAPDSRFMDYYEKGLVNQILGSKRDASSTSDPMVTYMVPVGPGATRGYGNIGTCCGGTGLENHTKYQDTIYLRSADSTTLYVNLYTASTLKWSERGLTVTQTGDYPRSDTSTLTVTGSGALDLRLRVPAWARTTFAVTLNGQAQTLTVGADGYLSLNRTWSSGDQVVVRFPFQLHVEKALDDPTLQAVLYGPVALVGKSSQTGYLSISGDVTSAFKANGAMKFLAGSVSFEPFYLGDTAAYHAYFRNPQG
jgi:DUF1680 family protein